MADRRPVPPAFRAAPFGPIDLYVIQLRIWAAELVVRTQRYREISFG